MDNKNDNWSYQERLFAIQLVGESLVSVLCFFGHFFLLSSRMQLMGRVIRLGQLDEQTIRFMQETIWNYLSNEFNPSSPSTNSQENGVTCQSFPLLPDDSQ